ncbi:MAG TPA: PP2C family protein-serine/threonine phosphatase [Bryobacteraceae bacterium]|jgi:sigma-B regulation protein RsbU (phosphoserine phosphatase)|nr:PP2C family protein-serine/threonine phosphatase [Bryobacteraceae bacterium]
MKQITELTRAHALLIAQTNSSDALLGGTVALLKEKASKNVTYFAFASDNPVTSTTNRPKSPYRNVPTSLLNVLDVWALSFIDTPAVTELLVNPKTSPESIDFLIGLRTDSIGLVRHNKRLDGVFVIHKCRPSSVIPVVRSIVLTTLVLYDSRAEFAQLKDFTEQEFSAASEVQNKLLAIGHVNHDMIDYTVAFKPLKIVSGDFYDAAILPNNRFFFAVGDAAGKGISAALVMAVAVTHLRRERTTWGSDLVELFYSLHKQLFACCPTTKYATLVCGVLDLASLNLQYISAGHQPPGFHITLSHNGADPRIYELDVSGPLVGLLPDPLVPYQLGRIVLHPGDFIAVATDGLTDGENREGDNWGVDRFRDAVRRGAEIHSTASDLGAAVLREQEGFCDGESPADDITLFIARVRPPKR